MINVTVKSNTVRSTINTSVDSTPAEVMEKAGVGTEGMNNLNGTILTATDLHSTFAQLGIADGSSCNLNSVVKADGANN